MSDQQCDIHDVTKAASDLMSFGCTTSATYLDSIMQLKFSSIIANYVNEVIRDVNDGVISAWDGMQELITEYDELANKAWFYAKNDAGIAGGFMQLKTGIESAITTRGLSLPYSGPMIAHGINNIYEGGMNIYNDTNSTVGPVKKVYREILRSEHYGDITYYSFDLVLAGVGLGRKTQKTDTFKLFRSMPEDYERAYKQTGRISLALQALVDGISIKSIYELKKEHPSKTTDGEQ